MKKPKRNEKLTDEAFSLLMTIAALGLLVSIVCLAVTSWAWYVMGI